MAIYQEIIDFNVEFNQLNNPPIIVNNLYNADVTSKENIKSLLISRFNSDISSILPSCQCGAKQGEYTIGELCEDCNTRVQPVMSDLTEPRVWFKRPEGIAPLINPIIWNMLSDKFTTSGFNVVQWLADITYRPTVRTPNIMQKIIEMNLQRGYNNFVENFDTYMALLFDPIIIKSFSKKTLVNGEDILYKLIKENRNKIFSEYLPLPDRSLLIIESNSLGNYADDAVIKAFDAILMITAIDNPYNNFSLRVKENRTINALAQFAKYYKDYYNNILSKKPGQFRRHIFASRTNFNFRVVVTSITDKHNYDEVHVPWCVGVTAFRPHLVNKLLKLNYNLNDAVGLLHGHVEKFHPLISDLLDQLIEESPEKGIPVLEHRNPTLLSGSMQWKKITKFKKDPSDHTASTSILTVKAPNTDFDGKLYCCH